VQEYDAIIGVFATELCQGRHGLMLDAVLLGPYLIKPPWFGI
jgi:hypothetical protein